ncbi:MAG: MBL fold metallo-hydrolase [Polyangiaceae bacterium]
MSPETVDLSRGWASFSARTPTLPPATHTQSYAIGTREVVLVEPATPYEDEQRAWLEWARGLVSQGCTLVGIFATHHHPDHVGGAAFFREALGLPLWAHEKTAARLPVWLDAKVDRLVAQGEIITLEGPTPTRWEALHTPGHAPGHLCLWERSLGAVIVGDMVASVGTILVEKNDGDMIQYLASLERLARLEAAVALPAHGGEIAAPSKLFRGYIAHRYMREGAVVRAVTDHPGTLDELVSVAYADVPPNVHPIARMSLEAHLIKLVREGRVREDADGRYTIVP